MKILPLLLLLTSCVTKYDTSKAIAILPSSEPIPDYTLSQTSLQVENIEDVVEFEGFEIEKIAKIGKGYYEFFNNKIYTASKKKLEIVDIQTLEKITILHSVAKPQIQNFNNFIIIYNKNGDFEIFKNNELSWKESVEGLASKFICDAQKCYALGLEGGVFILNMAEKTIERVEVSQKQNMLLAILYTPALINQNLIFADGNSNFTVFETTTKKVIGQSSFVAEDSTFFDINLVRQIYANSESVILSHINGVYAFNVDFLRPMWVKKYNFHNALMAQNFIAFQEKENRNIVLVSLKTGEPKWVKSVDFAVKTIKFGYENSMFVMEKDGVHKLNVETGEELQFRKLPLNYSYSFSVNGRFYFIKNGKLFKIK